MVSRSGSVRLAIVGLLVVAVLSAMGCGHSRDRYDEDDPDYWRGTLKDQSPTVSAPRRAPRRTTVAQPSGPGAASRKRPTTAKKPRKPAPSAAATKRPRRAAPALGKAGEPAVPAQSPYSPPAAQPPMEPQRVPAETPATAPTQEAVAPPAASPPAARAAPSVALVPPAAAAPAPAIPQTPVATSACDPDKPACALVRALAADPRRSWLQRAPTRNDTLSGVRLQALRETAGSLSCSELETARDEAGAAVPTLEDALAEARIAGQPVSPLSRTLLLASQLVTRLGEERLKRCR